MRIISDLKRPILLLAFCPVFAQAAGSAQIDFSHGNVTAVAASGEQRALVKGARVVSGETIRTGVEGRAQLRFDDGAMVSLQPQSEFRLDTYQFSGKQDGGERGFFSLLKGGLRTITGLIGRANKDAYKVTTSVATIGIRGTEYTLSYLDSETISVATGEGEIEICNRAGCVVLASGESAVISGLDGSVQRTAVRPRLDPTQPGQLLLADFSGVEGRNPDGSLALATGMQSGPGYEMAIAYDSSSNSEANVTAEFGAGSALLSATAVSGVYKSSAVAGAMSADSIIGWGRWSTGVLADSSTVNNLHYVIAKPASIADLAGLGTINATYTLVGGGYTSPTDQNGNVGSVSSGILTATIAGGLVSNVNLSLTVPINAHTYSLTTQSSMVNGSTFEITFAYNGTVYGGSARGVFTAGDARYAGAAYNFATMNNEQVSGAVVLKR